MKDTVNSMGKKLCQLQNNNNQLQEYIKCLEKDKGFSYNGKHISETTNRQRTLKAFLTRAETALWFSQAFGLPRTINEQICSKSATDLFWQKQIICRLIYRLQSLYSVCSRRSDLTACNDSILQTENRSLTDLQQICS